MTSPYKTLPEAAAYLRYDDGDGRLRLKSFYGFLKRHKVPTKRRGRQLLIHVDDLEACLKDVTR